MLLQLGANEARWPHVTFSVTDAFECVAVIGHDLSG